MDTLNRPYALKLAREVRNLHRPEDGVCPICRAQHPCAVTARVEAAIRALTPSR